MENTITTENTKRNERNKDGTYKKGSTTKFKGRTIMGKYAFKYRPGNTGKK